MFVDVGILKLLDQQLGYLSGCEWRLYPANTTITRATVLSDLGTEAAWGGYAAVVSGTWIASVIIGPGAVSQNTTLPVFYNTSGSAQVFYVVALVEPTLSLLVWAFNFGMVTIPDTASYVFSPFIKDQQL